MRRPTWTSERGFIVATLAATIGLGNIWRFPYLVGEQGGGAFILAYLTAIVIVGIPLMIMEFALGRHTRGSVVHVFRRLHRHAGIFGWFVIALNGVIMSYYLVITGWTLAYFAAALAGSHMAFDEFARGYGSLYAFILCTLLAGWILSRGLATLERFARLMMPLLYVLVIALAAYGLTLPGRDDALAFLFRWDLSTLQDVDVWLMALGQAFFSLGVGQGALVTYGSYMPAGAGLQRSAAMITGLETTISLLSGLILFPVVFTFGLPPDAGSNLAFNTLPVVFATLPGGVMLAILFFGLLFLSALSASIGGMKVIADPLAERFALSPRRAAWTTTAILLVAGTPSALSFTPLNLSVAGLPFLEFLDRTFASNVLVVTALIGTALIGWLLPRRRLIAKLNTRRMFEAHALVLIARFMPLVVLVGLLASALLG